MAEPKQVKAIKGGLNIAKRLLADKEQEALAKLDAGMKLSKAENVAAGLYHPIGEGKKLNVPFSRMTSTTVDNPDVIMHQGKIITPEQAVKERMGFFPLIGDRADTGKILTGVNNRKAKYDTPLTGGGKYMQANYDPIMEKSAGWESGAGKVGTLRNRIDDIVQSGYQPVGVFSPGSHVQVDFNTMMPHALLGQFEPTDTTKKLIKQFDKEVKSAYPNWAGITSPEAEAQLMNKGNGVLRTAFTKTMGKDDYQSGGFPDVPSVRKAISDPELYDTELGTLGQNMALFEPSGALVASPKNPSAYPLSMSAQNLGKLDQPEKYGEFFTTANERRRLMGSDPAGDYRSFELSQPIQYADEGWLNKLMESRRLRDEAIKAGGYKKGGAVDIDAADRRLAKAMEERMSGMAKGGKVDLEAADARLEAAINARMADGGEVGFKKIQFIADGGKVGKLVKGIANVGKRLMADEVPISKQLRTSGEPVLSHTDAMSRLGNGERLFAYHEMGGKPIPITSVDDLKKWTPDSLLSLPVSSPAMPRSVSADNSLPALEREANLSKFLEPSKIPQRLYHGTGSDITEFRPNTFFSDDPKIAGMYAKSQHRAVEGSGPNIVPVDVQLRKPFVFDEADARRNGKGFAQTIAPNASTKDRHKKALEILKNQGYDGVILKNYDDIGGRQNQYIAFEPTQVKSAIGNRGAYDIEDADITKAEGGPAFKKLQFMADGGITTSGGTFSASDLGITEEELNAPIISDKTLQTIKRNAPEVYDSVKQNIKDEAKQLKTAGGAKDFALRTGAQYLGAIPDLINLGLMLPDAVVGTSLASDKPYFGSEQIIDALKKYGVVGENEFPIAETVAGVLAPAGVIKKGVKQLRKMRFKQEPNKRRGGLAAMSR